MPGGVLRGIAVRRESRIAVNRINATSPAKIPGDRA